MAGIMYDVAGAGSGYPASGVAAQAFSINYLKAFYDRPGAWKHLRNFDADVSAFGQTVTVPIFPRLTAVDVTNSTGAFAYDNTSILPGVVTINKQKAVPFAPTYPVLTQSKIDIPTAFAEAAGMAVADSIDREVVKLIASLSTNTAGALGSNLTEAAIDDALGTLVANHVDVESNPQDLVWILPASQFSSVRQLKGYDKAYRIVAPSTESEGQADLKPFITTINGIEVHFRSDSEMGVSTGRIGGLFHRDSVGVAIQRMPSMLPPQRIPGTSNMEYVCLALYGVNVLKEYVACKLLCK